LIRVERLGLPNCYALTDGVAEVVVTTDVGPRVLGYRLAGGENILGECAGELVKTEWGVWRPYGGHRLWSAPEATPRSYAPDNEPVAFVREGERAIRLTPPAEERTGLQKQLTVALDGEGGVTLTHRITNLGAWRVELAAWALTVMRGGGTAIIPQEPYGPHPEHLLPARPLVVWPYTDMSDARFRFGRKMILVRSDASAAEPQKIGVGNKLGWAAYLLGATLFVKRFGHEAGARYPDAGCNNEVFTAGSFIELESLSPLVALEPGEAINHVERWRLFAGIEAAEGDEELYEAVAPLASLVV
jgi:hypothetical protein